MTDTTCQPIEATLNLPALTDHAAVLDALSQLLQAVATNQIGTRRANLLLRGLSLAARLTATLEKEKQKSAEPVSQETLSSINATASLDEDEVTLSLALTDQVAFKLSECPHDPQQQTQDTQRPYALQIPLQTLDTNSRWNYSRPNPSNAGTKQLVGWSQECCIS